MSQMTTALVADPVLTQIARGYKNPAFVGNALFPVVPVGLRGGNIIEFGKESFRLYETARAPGSKVAVAQFGYTGKPYTLTDHSISGLVPIEHLQEAANQAPSINLATGAVNFARNIILQRLEINQATIARTAGTYASSNKITLSSTSQWSDYSGTSDPIRDVDDYKEAVRARVGVDPNTILLPSKVFRKVKNHPKVLERIKYTGRDSATPEILAGLFEVENVVIGKGVYQDADGNMQDVWGKDVILAYTNTSPVSDMGAPSYGYTYQLSGYPVSEAAYYDNGHRSWLYPCTDSVSPVIAGADAGFLVINAIA